MAEDGLPTQMNELYQPVVTVFQRLRIVQIVSRISGPVQGKQRPSGDRVQQFFMFVFREYGQTMTNQTLPSLDTPFLPQFFQLIKTGSAFVSADLKESQFSRFRGEPESLAVGDCEFFSSRMISSRALLPHRRHAWPQSQFAPRVSNLSRCSVHR
jgi:hypothetical protein